MVEWGQEQSSFHSKARLDETGLYRASRKSPQRIQRSCQVCTVAETLARQDFSRWTVTTSQEFLEWQKAGTSTPSGAHGYSDRPWFIAIVLDLAALLFRVQNLGLASGIAIAAGILGALAAIITGFLDWEDVNPRELTVGLTHAIINIAATILFTISFFWRWGDNWQIESGKAALAIIAYMVVTLGGFLGGTLVFRMGTMVNRNAFISGPAEFVSVLAAKDLKDNQLARVDADGVPVLLVRRAGDVYALGAICSHFGAPLEEGKLENGSIECSWHNSQFALQDGSVKIGPATSPLPIYETRILNGKIQVKVKK